MRGVRGNLSIQEAISNVLDGSDQQKRSNEILILTRALWLTHIQVSYEK